MATLTPVEEVIEEGKLKELLINAAKSTSNYVEMLLLPTLTAVCGLMGRSKARTHEDKNFQEINIIWSCVAAAPGNKICAG